MSDYGRLPLGWRNNNPGNLRRSVGPNKPVPVKGGFAIFPDLHSGVESLFYLIDQYRIMGHAETVQSFVGRYAPASENDVLTYVQTLLKFMGLGGMPTVAMPMNVALAATAMLLARGVIHVELGPTPSAWPNGREWVDPGTMADAMRATGKWAM